MFHTDSQNRPAIQSGSSVQWYPTAQRERDSKPELDPESDPESDFFEL